MNACSKNQGIATSASVEIPLEEREKTNTGTSMTDLESQQSQRVSRVTRTNTVDTSSAGSGDQLVDGQDSPAFIQHAPPTFKETAACVAFCFLGTALVGVSMFFLEGRIRPIPVQYLESSGEYVRNLVISEVYKGETIDTLGLFLLCIFAPGAIQSAYGFARGQKGDFYRTICTYSVALTITGMVSELIKNYVGYMRPIFFDQCDPDDQYQSCTGDGWTQHELSKSFVSGHASMAFCGGVLFSLFLERTIGVSSVAVAVARQVMMPTEALPMSTSSQPQSSVLMVSLAYRQPPGWRKVGSIVALFPMLVSIWVACSRVVDNVHHPADIVGGAVLGAAVAAYCHPIWYPDPRFLP